VESLGDKLKTARENKGYELNQAGRETNISVKYLEALEAEDFSCFPGEPYLIGFLRNYGNYLGLNTDELLSLYKSLKIQEQPLPITLLKSPSRMPQILTGAAIAALVLGAASGGIFLFMKLFNAPAAAPAREPVTYEMQAGSLEKRFYKGDSILIPLGNEKYKLVFSNIGDAVTLTAPEGSVTLNMGRETALDLNNDGVQELRITALEFAKDNPSSGAILSFTTGASSGVVSPADSEPQNSAAAGAVPIVSSTSAFPFTLNVAFQNSCLFRWEVLNEPDTVRHEEYFLRGAGISVEARNTGMRVGTSNASAVKLQIFGRGETFPLVLGGAGEVVAADIRWWRDNNNQFRLMMIPLD